MLECVLANTSFKVIGIWLLLSGAIGFFVMGIDKTRAIYGEWRTPEKTLFAIAIVGGAFGVALGGALFHHKTSKLGFFAVLCATVVAWLLFLQRIGFLDCLASSIPS